MKSMVSKIRQQMTIALIIFVVVAVPILARIQIAHAAVSTTIDTNQHYQNVNGLGINANVHNWKNGDPKFKAVLDQTAQLGSITWRVIIDRSDWETVNDDNDPFHLNMDVGPNSYNTVYSQGKMADLWNTIAYINSLPNNQQVVINTMGGDPSWMSGVSGTAGTKVIPGMEDEWVEQIASMVYYGKVVRGLNFTLLSPTNEEDFTNGIEGVYFPPAQYADVMHRLATRLDSLGLNDIRFVGPDTATSTDARDIYYPAIKNDPVVMNKVAHVSLHAYTASLAGTPDVVKAAFPDKDLWVTEYAAPCSGCDDGAPNPNNWSNAAGSFDQLLSDLDQGAAGAQIYDGWDGWYEHHGPATNSVGQMGYWGLFAYTGNQTTDGTYTPRKSYYVMKQAMAYVPRTSVMVGATSSGSVTIRAFTDAATGRLTIIGENTGTTAQTLNGTINASAGFASKTLAYTRTNASVNMGDENLAPVAVTASNTFSVDVPANTVFTLTGTTAPADNIPPTAPVLDSPSVNQVNNQVDLSWSPSTDAGGLAGYRVFRSADQGQSYTQLTSAILTGTIYSDTTAQPNTTYNYKVRAYDIAGNNSDSNTASITTAPDTTPPSAPSNFTATAQTANRVNLSWQSGSADSVSYTVSRSDLATPLASNVTTTTYSDTSVSPDTTYTYTVTAADASNNMSVPATATVSTPSLSPIAVNAQVTTTQSSAATSISSTITTTQPALLVAYITSDGPSGAQSYGTPTAAGLTWTLRKRANTQVGTAEIWTAPASAPLTNTSITATRTATSYRGAMTVTAFSGADLSAIGATAGASASTGATSLSLTPTKAGSVIWGVGYSKATASARTVGPNQTKVQEYLGGSTGTSWVQKLNDPIVTPGAPVTLNDTAPTNQRWNFAAIEILPAVPSGPDTTVPTAPTLTATASANQVNLSWSAATDNIGVTSYDIYRDAVKVATVNAATLAYVDNTVTSGAAYDYYVVALDAAGNATSSNIVTATTPLPDTTAPTVSITTPTDSSNVGGTVAIAATASDAGGVAGVQFFVDGVATGPQDTSAPYQYSWDTTTASNGSHTLTAVATDTAGNQTTTSPVVVTVFNAPSTLAVDKQISAHPTTSSASITATGMTTTKTNDLLVAFVTSDGPSTASSMSFTSVSGGGLTWTLKKRVNAQYGTSEIWTAVAPSTLSNVSITATRASSSFLGSLVVVAFSGADTTASGAIVGASASTGAPSVSLTTTRSGSQVWAVGNDWDNATARTVGTGQTLADQYLLSVGDTLWVQRTTNPVANAGTLVTMNDTAPTNHRWNFAAIEITPLP